MNRVKKGIKIGLVISDVIFRNGMASFISQHEGMEVVFAAGDIETLESFVQQDIDLDICIADQHLHREETARILATFQHILPSLKFILFSNTGHPYNIKKAIAIGCKGMINKHADATTIIKAILSVHFTGRYYEKSYPMDAARESNELITDQESRVLKILCSNKTSKEISTELNMSPSIINAYKALLFKKLQVSSREMLIKCAYSLGLIEANADRDYF